MHQQWVKLQIYLDYVVIIENVISERVVVILKAVEVNWFHVTHALAHLIINSIHAWLAKDYRLPYVSNSLV